MNLISCARRRAAAVMITSAAIVLPSAGMAAASQAARTAAVPQCSTSQLRVWLGIPGSSASGMTAYELELSNVSKHTCMLIGFPGVSAVGSNGHRLGSPAVRDHSDPARPVILSRGVTAHVFLRILM